MDWLDYARFEVQFARPAWCGNAKTSILSGNAPPLFWPPRFLNDSSVFSVPSVVKMRPCFLITIAADFTE